MALKASIGGKREKSNAASTGPSRGRRSASVGERKGRRASVGKKSTALNSATNATPRSKILKRSISAPSTAHAQGSTPCVQNGLTTPSKRCGSSSAFGRSSTSRVPSCVELWGPLSVKQRAAADVTPMHMRPGIAHKNKRKAVPRSGSLSKERHQKTDDTFTTPQSRPSTRYSEVASSNFTAPSIPPDEVYKLVEDMLVSSEFRERSAIEWGAANCLKTCVSSFRLGLGIRRKPNLSAATPPH
eukprot:TRINITY_DN4592_c0_g1_i2.p1 TRINITY_DN4592_c0_g1~~TRINITY_DN4592_c0_g1_i2.p1  ORF type:complete len:243 (+),score=21.76 TRINITY_DN4592_c0_g1_i2:42-770(+)